MDMLQYNYQSMLKRSKNLTYRAEVTEMTEVLMRFLKDNELIKSDPFNEDGSLKSDLVLRRSDLSDMGNSLLDQFFPKWSAFIDRGGDASNTKILSAGLKRIMLNNE
ncbi:hypothetical protein [Pseudomonas salmasensis]|uniref:hypothetical protein n=1 Tax=Pseudomonas salmasensis TaxID=2745514 RepID=UPI00192DD348|nr:hypothetical protein [Pseudomonas salmasensis]QXH77893.1 hypothetical protein HU731_026315 [Pseudomonas salmasensis]